MTYQGPPAFLRPISEGFAPGDRVGLLEITDLGWPSGLKHHRNA